MASILAEVLFLVKVHRVSYSGTERNRRQAGNFERTTTVEGPADEVLRRSAVLLALGLILNRGQLSVLLETTNALLDSAGYAALLRLPRLGDERLNSVHDDLATAPRD